MRQAIDVLPGSYLHLVNIELCKRHQNRGDGRGRCGAYGQLQPCPAARHAALVIQGAGEDPRWYDDELPTTGQTAGARRDAVAAAVLAGYPVGDDSRGGDIAHAAYER